MKSFLVANVHSHCERFSTTTDVLLGANNDGQMTEATFISDYYRRVFATLELITVCKTYQDAF